MEISESTDSLVPQKTKVANFGPLGLFGFGLTTILLNLHNVGAFELNIAILSMGIFFGGFAQFLAGLFELKHGNTFGGTAFVGYGIFWVTLVLIWVNPFAIDSANNIAMGSYLSIWALFTLILFVCTFKHNNATKLVFGSLFLLFLLLAIADFSSSDVITKIAGVVGILCGLSAVYNGAGQIINEQFEKAIFPL